MSLAWSTFSNGRIHQIKHRKKWQSHQTFKYFDFLLSNKFILQEADRNKKHQVYNRMSQTIGSRSTHQCRSHHQKIIKRFRTIDNFCKLFKAKTQHPKHLIKTQFSQESFSDDKKPRSSKSQNQLKNEKISSKNLEHSDQQSSDKDSQPENQLNQQKHHNSNMMDEKLFKQSFLKNVQTGTKNSELNSVDQKEKKIRKRRRRSHKNLDQQKIVDNKCVQSEKKQGPQFPLAQQQNQNFLPTHQFPYQNSYMMMWDRMLPGQFPSPFMTFGSELRDLTELHMTRVSQHDSLRMLDDGINYLMMKKNMIEHSIRQRIEQEKEMSRFTSYVDERMGPKTNEQIYGLVADKNKDQLPTGISVGEVMQGMGLWPVMSPNEKPCMGYMQKVLPHGFQIQNSYQFHQNRQADMGLTYIQGRVHDDIHRMN